MPGRVEGDEVIITESQQMTAAAGKAVFELLIDGETHGTANFVVLVEPRPGDGAVVSASDYSLFQEAINSIAIAGSGAPAVATLASEMTDEGKVYLYAGSESGYTNGHWYYYNGSAWTDGGKYGGTVDATLTMSGVAADAKKVGDEINDLKSEISTKTGLSEEVKQISLALFRAVAYTIKNGQSLYDAYYNALYPPANLTSITAVFNQGLNVIYDTDSLDDLKRYLTVTAHYDDSSTATITNYVLSGTLAEGTSTITVIYGGKTTTFTVIVEHYTVHYDGLYTPQTVITGEYIDENGEITAASESSGYFEEYLPVENGGYIDVKYTSDDVDYNRNFRVSIYDSSKNFVRQIQTRQKGEMYFHLENDESYFRLGYYSVGGNPQFYLYDAEAMPMEIGDVSASDGSESEQPKRIRSDFIPVGANPVAQGCPFYTSWPNNYVYAWRCFDENKGYLENVSVLNTTNPTLPTGTAYIRAVIQYSNASHTFTSGWSSEVLYAIRIGDKYYVPTEAE